MVSIGFFFLFGNGGFGCREDFLGLFGYRFFGEGLFTAAVAVWRGILVRGPLEWEVGVGQGFLGRNVLEVINVTVALGDLCNFVHEMAACVVVSGGIFRGWGILVVTRRFVNHRDGYVITYQRGGNSWE